MSDRAFSRVLELVLVLVLLFALVTTISQNLPPIASSSENLQVLTRYSSDLRNMMCNSERDRGRILANLSLVPLNESFNYVTPPDLRHRIVIFNVTDYSVVQSIGYPLPADSSIMTSSCILMDGDTILEAEVMVWH